MWVIAETKELGTPMIKIVVTDDQGRFLLPELPARITRSGCAVMDLADSTPVDAKPSALPVALKVADREDPAGSREGLSGRLLAVAAGAARQESVPRTPDTRRQRLGTRT